MAYHSHDRSRARRVVADRPEWAGRIAAARFFVAVLALNVLLTLENLWPTPWVRPAWSISFEFAGLVLVMALWVGLTGRLRTGARVVLGAVLFLFVLLHYTDVTALGLLGRPIDVYWEAWHAPRLIALAWWAFPGWLVVAALCGAGASLVALAVCVGWLCGMLAGALERPRIRHAALIGSTCVVAILIGGTLLDQPPAQARFRTGVARQLSGIGALINTSDPTPTLAAPGGGADVIVLFVESYGMAALDEPRLAAPLSADLLAFTAAIAAAGWHVTTARVEAPTIGGGSWLSHATFLSRHWIGGPAGYRRYLQSPLGGLTALFRDAGYRTVGVFPGIKQAWPEGAAYGFEQIYDADALGYTGPAYGWWTIPDQFVLEVLHARELDAENRAPVFAVYASLASHFPFTPVPPYRSDWAAAAVPASAQPLPTNATTGDRRTLDADYVRAMRYNLDWLHGFLDAHAGENSVVIVLGDHQPPAIVAGPGVPWHVPVHVFSREPDTFAALEAGGFDRGLVPRESPVGRMDALGAMIWPALMAAAH